MSTCTPLPTHPSPSLCHPASLGPLRSPPQCLACPPHSLTQVYAQTLLFSQVLSSRICIRPTPCTTQLTPQGTQSLQPLRYYSVGPKMVFLTFLTFQFLPISPSLPSQLAFLFMVSPYTLETMCSALLFQP